MGNCCSLRPHHPHGSTHASHPALIPLLPTDARAATPTRHFVLQKSYHVHTTTGGPATELTSAAQRSALTEAHALARRIFFLPEVVKMSAVALAAKTETQLYREVMGIPFYTKEGDDYRDLDPIDPALVTVDSELLTLIEQFKTHCDYKIYVDRSYPHATGSVQKPKYGCTWYNPKGKTIKIALQGHMVTDLGAADLRREDLPETWSAHVFYMAVVIIHELAHALRFFTGRYLPTPVKISGGVTTQIPHPNSSLPYLHGEGGAYLERFLFGGKVNAIMMPEDDEDLAFSGQYAGLIASPANDSTESWWLSMDMIVQIVEGQSGWDRCIPLGRDMFHQPTIWGPMENKARADSSEQATLQPETEAEHGSVEYWEGRERLDLSCGGAKIVGESI